MKSYGSINNKSRTWHLWGDKIPTKQRTYFNKSTRGYLKKSLRKEVSE